MPDPGLSKLAKTPLVLLVEDSLVQAQKLSALLKNIYALNVLHAADGVDALRVVNSYHPDVIVVDLNFPRMDGYQLCKWLKRDSRTLHIPVIMLTATDNPAASEALKVEANECIRKDAFVTDNLISTLRNYLNFR
jgi:two-component system cell cycle response regulator